MKPESKEALLRGLELGVLGGLFISMWDIADQDWLDMDESSVPGQDSCPESDSPWTVP